MPKPRFTVFRRHFYVFWIRLPQKSILHLENGFTDPIPRISKPSKKLIKKNELNINKLKINKLTKKNLPGRSVGSEGVKLRKSFSTGLSEKLFHGHVEWNRHRARHGRGGIWHRRIARGLWCWARSVQSGLGWTVPLTKLRVLGPRKKCS